MSYRLLSREKNKIWVGTAVNQAISGILTWVIGDRSSHFEPLWRIVEDWNCSWHVTDGYVVYKSFIEAKKHIVSKTAMTRVEGENGRLRHDLARLHRQGLCYSKDQRDVEFIAPTTAALSEDGKCSYSTMTIPRLCNLAKGAIKERLLFINQIFGVVA